MHGLVRPTRTHCFKSGRSGLSEGEKGKGKHRQQSRRDRLEILIQNKSALIRSSSSARLRLLAPSSRLINTSLSIITNPLLEEIRLPLQRNHIHKVKRVNHMINLFIPQRHQQPIRDEFDILIHQSRIHPDERNGECVGEEFLFDRYGFHDDVLDGIGMRAFTEVTEEETCKVGVHAFVTGDELVGKSKTRHETAFLEPKDGRERTREEDSLDGCESDQPFTECRAAVRDPFEGPVGFSLDAGDVLDGVEEVLALDCVFNVCVDEERVCFRVDVFPVYSR
jgi:hypothetical protein